MKQTISFVTLGASAIPARSRKFYAALAGSAIIRQQRRCCLLHAGTAPPCSRRKHWPTPRSRRRATASRVSHSPITSSPEAAVVSISLAEAVAAGSYAHAPRRQGILGRFSAPFRRPGRLPLGSLLEPILPARLGGTCPVARISSPQHSSSSLSATPATADECDQLALPSVNAAPAPGND